MRQELLRAPDVSFWLKEQLRTIAASEKALTDLGELHAFICSWLDTPALSLTGYLASRPLKGAHWSGSMLEQGLDLKNRDPVDALNDIELLMRVIVNELNESL